MPLPIVKFQFRGIIAHANAGRTICAAEKNIPVDSITRERYRKPCNSLKYDISTANGPLILRYSKLKIDTETRKLLKSLT